MVFSAGFKGAPGRGGALVGEAFFPGDGICSFGESQLLFIVGEAWVSSKLPVLESPLPGAPARPPCQAPPLSLLLGIQLLSIKQDQGPDFPAFDVWPALLILQGKAAHETVPALGLTLTVLSGPYHNTGPQPCVHCKPDEIECHRTSQQPCSVHSANYFGFLLNTPKPSGLRFNLPIYTEKLMTKNRKPVLCFNLCNSSSIPQHRKPEASREKVNKLFAFHCGFSKET